MVRIGKFQLHYFFSEEDNKPSVWLQIESSDVTVVNPQGISTKADNFSKAGGPLCLLIGLTVDKASRRDDGGLVLELSGGSRLEIGIHSPKYESIVLHIGSESVVG